MNQQSQARSKQATATAIALAAAVKPTETATLAPKDTPTPSSFGGTVKVDGAELRSAPSDSSSTYGVLPQGSQLTIRARSADNTWLLVEAAGGTSGWILAKSVDLGNTQLAAIPQSVLQSVPTATPNLAATAAACKPAAQVTDVTVPDSSQFKPGDAFVKTWRLTSSGNCPWEKGSTLVFKSGDKLEAPDSVPVEVVDVGQSVDVSLNLKAPQAPGTYAGQWALQRPSGQLITSTDVTIVVVAPTPTAGVVPTLPPVATRPAATPTSGATGGIPPVGTGSFNADPSASGPWNCVRLSENEWAGEFYIGVYGGPGNYTISDTTNCRWDPSQQKFACRYASRYDGSVSVTVQVSCPGCKPQSVNIFGRAVTGGKDLPSGTCRAN
jgi:uncharacterized protein YraI